MSAVWSPVSATTVLRPGMVVLDKENQTWVVGDCRTYERHDDFENHRDSLRYGGCHCCADDFEITHYRWFHHTDRQELPQDFE